MTKCLILLCIALAQPFILHGAETASASAATTIAKVPLTQDQITDLAQQAIADNITSQTHKYKATLQKKLAALLTFRSQPEAESYLDKIIMQWNLHRGYIQADQHVSSSSTSSDVNKQSWLKVFKDKLLIKSTNEREEATWAHETASLLVQYWPMRNAYSAQNQRKQVESLKENSANDAMHIQRSTIAKVPLTEDQIAIITQESIARYVTPQAHRYEKTLQNKLFALLAFRSQLQPNSLRDKSAGLVINQQGLWHGYIQNNPLTNTTASSFSVFKSKLLMESASTQAETTWADEIASLLVQYLPIYNAHKSEKNRELVARKRDKASGSVEETQELLPKNRRCNDSPALFVSEIDTDLFLFDSPMPIFTEDYFQIGEHDES